MLFHRTVRSAWRARQAKRGRLGAAAANDPTRGARRACVKGGIASGRSRRAATRSRDLEIQRRMAQRARQRAAGDEAETIAAIAAATGATPGICVHVDRRNSSRHSFIAAPRSGASGSGVPAVGRRRTRPVADSAPFPDPAASGGRPGGPAAAGEAGDHLLLDAQSASRREAGSFGFRGDVQAEAPRQPGRAPPDAGSGRPAGRNPAGICLDCCGLGFVGELGALEACTCAAGEVWAERRRRRRS